VEEETGKEASERRTNSQDPAVYPNWINPLSSQTIDTNSTPSIVAIKLPSASIEKTTTRLLDLRPVDVWK
jgi:hypothetical protein